MTNEITITITLEEFKERLAADIEGFVKNWLERQKTDPAGWPTNMGEGDWYEQLLAHLNLGDYQQ